MINFKHLLGSLIFMTLLVLKVKHVNILYNKSMTYCSPTGLKNQKSLKYNNSCKSYITRATIHSVTVLLEVIGNNTTFLEVE